MDTLTLQLLIEKMATETDKEKILNLKQEIDTFLFGKGMFGNAWIKIENVGSIQNPIYIKKKNAVKSTLK